MSEEMTPEFMQGNPTREEVNKYMNNLFAAVQNSFGVFQGYTITALAKTITEKFEKVGLTVTPEEFLKEFSEHNAKIIQEAQQKLEELHKQAQTNMKAAQAEPEEDTEVDVSVL